MHRPKLFSSFVRSIILNRSTVRGKRLRPQFSRMVEPAVTLKIGHFSLCMHSDRRDFNSPRLEILPRKVGTEVEKKSTIQAVQSRRILLCGGGRTATQTSARTGFEFLVHLDVIFPSVAFLRCTLFMFVRMHYVWTDYSGSSSNLHNSNLQGLRTCATADVCLCKIEQLNTVILFGQTSSKTS